MKSLQSSPDAQPKPWRSWRAWIVTWVVVAIAAFVIRGSQNNVIAAPGEQSADAKQADTKQYDEQVRPFLARHCQECHRGEKPKGKLHVDQLTASFSDAAVREKWHAVLQRIKAGEMPPKDKPRPSEQEVQALANWITGKLQGAESSTQDARGRVVLRRLNRFEYENTLRDLLGVSLNLKEQLPQDGSANGFDNAGAALHTSSFLMEKYLEAAETALNLAISNRPQPPALVQKRVSIKDGHPIRGATEKVYRFLDDGEVVCFSSSAWNNVSVPTFYPTDGGNYRFRISASGYQSSGKPVTFCVSAGRGRKAGKSGTVGYFDAPADQSTVFEFIQYMEPQTGISILPYGLASAQTVNKVGADAYDGPGLAVQWVEFEGPLHESWPPASHRGIFGDLKQKPALIYNQSTRVEVASSDPLVDADGILRSFTRRAFRRTVTNDDLAPYIEIVKAKLAVEYSFEQAIRAALKGVLMSPEFLFLRETPGKLDDFALAARLSYFFWSSMPDEDLLTLAEQKKLNDPAVLRAQVERMLKDPKAAAFSENFVGQWLGLREIDATEPSHILYPEYDHMLKVSMIREAELFFEEVLKNDLSLANFVDSDFAMLNGRLAKHYGIPGVDGWELKKTPLPPESHRGGVLTMASVLKVTANGTTTSPVLRGVWVLDRILGTPPLPPPDDVPVLEPDIRGATTIRDQLAKHRSVAMCASCHTKIDPPGFALESFDCIGGWRDNYRATGNGKPVVIDGRRMLYLEGKPVDPSDVLPDGRRFDNVDQFKKLLLSDKDQLARALTFKLLTYATGAAPTLDGKSQIEAIVSKVRENDYGLRSLIHQIVQSEMFQTK